LTFHCISSYFSRVIDDSWTDIAAAQAGTIARPQLIEAGLDDAAIRRRVANGRLRVALPGVYVVAGTPSSTRQRRWVGHLAVGPASVLSFETAARFHRLAGVPRQGPTVLTVPHSGWQRLPGIVVHQISDLARRDILIRDGLPYTSVPRTIVDLAAVWRPGRLATALDDADTAGLTTLAHVGACLRSVARRGKPGVRLLTTLLDERGPGEVPPASELERAFFRLIEQSDIEPPRRQHPLPRDDGVLGLADAAWPAIKLIVEVDGRRWHQRIADMKKDRDRDMKAAGVGWQVVRPLHEHIVGAPEETIRELRAVIAARRSQLFGAA
jgi:very-short-patch-repair endonuclease